MFVTVAIRYVVRKSFMPLRSVVYLHNFCDGNFKKVSFMQYDNMTCEWRRKRKRTSLTTLQSRIGRADLGVLLPIAVAGQFFRRRTWALVIAVTLFVVLFCIFVAIVVFGLPPLHHLHIEPKIAVHRVCCLK